MGVSGVGPEQVPAGVDNVTGGAALRACCGCARCLGAIPPGPRAGGGRRRAGLECSAKNVVTVGLMRNDLSRVLIEARLGDEGYGIALRLVVQESRHGVVEFSPPRGVVD